MIARPEKALCDELYTVKQVHTAGDFKNLLFDDLRIDRLQLLELDWALICELAPGYKRSNTDYLISYWEKEIKNERNTKNDDGESSRRE